MRSARRKRWRRRSGRRRSTSCCARRSRVTAIPASGRATSARPELASACSPWAARLRGRRAGPSRTKATAENRSPSSSPARSSCERRAAMADLIWVYAEVVDGKISRATLELLSKAAELGTTEAVLLGPAPDDAITTLSQHGASKVYRSDDAIYRDHPTLPAVETIAALIASHRPAVMLFASSYGGRDVAATLSAKLDCGALTDVGDLTLTGGAIEATIPALGGSYQNSATLTGSGTKLIL